MSNRAEEAAWKVYPKRPEQKCITAFGTFEFDHDAPNREGFIKGYEQAEKDLIEIANRYLKEPLYGDDLLPAACFLAGQISEALTWEDVKLICDLKMELELDDDLPPRSQELYEAVLLAFKQRKEDLRILLNIKL